MPMDLEEENNVFGMNEGCPEHGAEHMAECTACGEEFCALCFPRSAVCADCAESSSLDDDARTEEFDDVEKIDKLLDDQEAPPGAEEESP
ncbi:MAG: hypothetical protein EPN23_00560 [Verrucomicrobia bacterium]|nr:MAG: hypothetical protein EPN23_00560 [Verrucomicrobiota bacterium]